MKFEFRFDDDLHTFLRCLLWNAPELVLESEWGVVSNGATMYRGVSEPSNFIPTSQRVTVPVRPEYLYCCSGEILMQRASLVCFHNETIIRRVAPSMPLGYDTDIYVNSVVYLQTDCVEIYDAASQRG